MPAVVCIAVVDRQPAIACIAVVDRQPAIACIAVIDRQPAVLCFAVVNYIRARAVCKVKEEGGTALPSDLEALSLALREADCGTQNG